VSSLLIPPLAFLFGGPPACAFGLSRACAFDLSVGGGLR